jgi:hypothetical protein
MVIFGCQAKIVVHEFDDVRENGRQNIIVSATSIHRVRDSPKKVGNNEKRLILPGGFFVFYPNSLNDAGCVFDASSATHSNIVEFFH